MEHVPHTSTCSCSQANCLVCVSTRGISARLSEPRRKKKRVRNRPKHPRAIQPLGAGPYKSSRMVKIGWEREEDFQQEAYEAIESYLLARKCRVKRRPQAYTASSADQLERTLFVWFANTKKAYQTIKQQVSRMNCGMSTWIVYSDPFAVEQPEMLKGA